MSIANLSINDKAQGDARPEWERVPGIVRRFGIGKSSVYNLMNDGKIKTCSLPIRGKGMGPRQIRLVSVASVEAYLEAHVQHKGDGEAKHGIAGTEAA